jgi:hypothetical protein
MSTLIAVYNSEGCVGRCDAKCYEAKEPACDCICRGANHGAGLTKAMENTRELADEWLEAYEEKTGLNIRERLEGAPPPQLRVKFRHANAAVAIVNQQGELEL